MIWKGFGETEKEWIWKNSNKKKRCLCSSVFKEHKWRFLLCARQHTFLYNIIGMFRRSPEFFLEGSGKGGIVPETAGITGFCHAFSVLDLCFGRQKALFADIGAYGVSGFRLKKVHQIRTAYKK